MQIAAAIVVVNAPLIATQLIGVAVESAGFTLVAPAAMGAALGAYVIPKLLSKGFRKKKVIEFSFILLALIVFTITFVAPRIPTITLFIAIISLFSGGFGFIGILIPAQTMLQEKTPGGLRGRVFGNFWFMVTVATIFPVIFSGTIAEIFGVEFMMLFLIVFCIISLIFSVKMGDKLLKNNKSYV